MNNQNVTVNGNGIRSIQTSTTNNGVTSSFSSITNSNAEPVNSSKIMAQSFQAPFRPTSLGSSITNGKIAVGQSLNSENGKYSAEMQGDGNFVVYQTGDDGSQGKPIWTSNTNGKADGGQVAMQADGNLVVYDANQKPQFSADTYSAGSMQANRPFNLTMQNDSNLVVTDPEKGNQPLWGSMGGRYAKAQDGTQDARNRVSHIAQYNAGLIDKQGQAIWKMRL